MARAARAAEPHVDECETRSKQTAQAKCTRCRRPQRNRKVTREGERSLGTAQDQMGTGNQTESNNFNRHTRQHKNRTGRDSAQSARRRRSPATIPQTARRIPTTSFRKLLAFSHTPGQPAHGIPSTRRSLPFEYKCIQSIFFAAYHLKHLSQPSKRCILLDPYLSIVSTPRGSLWVPNIYFFTSSKSFKESLNGRKNHR